VESLHSSETTTDGLIIIDKEDYRDNEKEYVKITLPAGWKYHITEPTVEKMGDKVRAAWKRTKNYTAVNLLNDDHYIITKGWDKKLLKDINGWNFVTCLDNWMSPTKAAGATVFSKKLLDTIGWPIYPPNMIHLFIDDLWETIGRATGCWEIDHSVTIEHRHPLKGESPVDETFTKTYGDVKQDLSRGEVWQNDEAVYREIVTGPKFKEIIDQIRELMGLIPIRRQA
jgi:hypothetical protein